MILFQLENCKTFKKLWATLILCAVFPFISQAKLFSTSYISFDIPKNWTCTADGANYICHNSSKKLAREAVIIMAAKATGPQDTLSSYITYLKKKRSYTTKKGKPASSSVFHTKQVRINAHPWVDGFHLGSEIPPYYTRYLVSTKKGLSVLVTYSAHKTKWKKYISDFTRSIKSLRISNVDAALRKLKDSAGMSSGRGIRDYLEGIVGDGDLDFEDSEEGGEGLLSTLFDKHLGKTAAGLGGGAAASALGWKFLANRRRKGASPSSVISSSRRRRRKK